MNTKKVLSDILGVKYASAMKSITPLTDGETVKIGEYVITSIYRKTISGKDIHYIQIEKDGVFVGKIGV